jgi:hypothetical protein
MTLPALDSALLSSRLAQMAQLMRSYDSKTDQTAQTDQRVEIADQISVPPGQRLTGRAPKLTSGTDRQPDPRVQAVGTPLDSTDACTSNGAALP